MSTIKLYDYQIDATKQIKNGKVNVLAMCPGGGKTKTAINYALNNKFKKVLILAHGTNVIGTQWHEEFKNLGIEFSGDVTNKTKFIISIPQAIRTKDIPKFDLVIVDEAHEFYAAKMVQQIIKKAKPKTQLLLTGTPSKFIKTGTKPIVVSGVEVYNAGFLADTYFGLVRSAYDLDIEDFNSDGECDDKEVDIKASTNESFRLLILKMVERLTENKVFKSSPNAKNTMSLLKMSKLTQQIFESLDKTMIATRSIKQAEIVKSILDAQGIKAVLSHSENDKGSQFIEDFRNDPKVKVLIVVDRGILGFNMPELINVVDFTMSRNIDRIYQLYARTLRPFGKKNKFFFRICSRLNAEVDAFCLQAALCLNSKDFISRYNGKNLREMEIIVPREKKERKVKLEKTKKGIITKTFNIDEDLSKYVLSLDLLTEMTINPNHKVWKEWKKTTYGYVIGKLKPNGGIPWDNFAEFVKDAEWNKKLGFKHVG